MKKVLFAGAALVVASPAFAAHVVVYAPRTEAFASSAAHQGPNVVGSNSHWVNGAQDVGGSFAGNAGMIDGGGTPTNTFASAYQDGGTGAGPLHNDSYASANLATGLLKATTTSTGGENFGSPLGFAQSRLDDTIFFTNTSGGAVTVSLTYSFDGQIYNPFQASANANPGGNVSLILSCGGNLYGCNNGANGNGDNIVFAKANGAPALLPNNSPVTPFDTNWTYYFDYQNTSSCFGENIYCGQYSSNLWEYGLNAPNAGGVVDGYIRAYLNIPTGQTSLGLRGLLNLDCRTGSSCDFGHTGAFAIGALPTGLAYSSASGVFLTENATPGAVPEPASWALMIAGFGLVGGAMRRRRIAVAFA